MIARIKTLNKDINSILTARSRRDVNPMDVRILPGLQPGVPPSPLFSKISGISGLAGDPGVKILIPKILEVKY